MKIFPVIIGIIYLFTNILITILLLLIKFNFITKKFQYFIKENIFILYLFNGKVIKFINQINNLKIS